MAAGDFQDFEFIGGPYDGEVLPVADQGDGIPEVLVVDHTWDDRKPPKSNHWTQHRYERDGLVYRYVGPADPRAS